MKKGTHHTEATLKKISESNKGKTSPMKGKHHSPESINKMRISCRKRKISPMLGKHHTITTRNKISESKKGKVSPKKGKPLSKEQIIKMKNSCKGKYVGEKNGMYGKHHSDITRQKIGDASKGRFPTETTRKKIGDFFRGKPKSAGHREKIGEGNKGKKLTLEQINLFKKPKSAKHLEKIVETRIGGFWYGNVRYRIKKKYCELWNWDLWQRIDAYQNFKSILSGKTKEDNGDYALSRHHVYWQEKACCEWDEDLQGYFAMINIGTAKNPNIYKHKIGNDPNKFVLLTRKEHGMVAKDKLKWIKIFEDLIEKHGGKCYYTKAEWKAMKDKL
jgi:hypothetical protein